MPSVGEPFECLSIPVAVHKELVVDPESKKPKLDEYGKEVYYCGFSVGGGIDQDPKLSPQKFTDKGIYITSIKPESPAAKSNLQINDKILEVNGYDFTMIPHYKAVEYLKRGNTLNMFVSRK